MTNFELDTLAPGIPRVSNYMSLLTTNMFHEMESFNNEFIKRNPHALTTDHTVADGFHTWSRQWEYPFTYSYIRQYLSEKVHADDEVRILDAGSGYTFFPYYLSEKYPNCKMDCCDRDVSLAQLYLQANKKRTSSVDFEVHNLANMGYEDNFFDIVYCISVLEHTENYGDIVKEFKRILKPEGLLVLTFDISLDRRAKITKGICQNILNELGKYFRANVSLNLDDAIANISERDMLTTKFMKMHDEHLLPPWRRYFNIFTIIRQLLKGKLPRPFYYLTVFCGVYKQIDD